MQITIDTDNLSALDLQVLALLGGGEAPAPEPKAAPAKKTAKKPAPKAAEPVEEPEVAEEPEEAEEDLVGGGEVTMKDAVALATKLVSNGGSADVKAALAKVGAKRVSDIADEDLATFVGELS